jgi:hypothetical protein
MPAEIHGRGCSFAERFHSQAEVEANGGIIVGAPTIDFGANLDGLNDAIDFQLSGDEFNNQQISYIATFCPFFDADIDSNVYLLNVDNSGSNDWWVRKRPNANLNTLWIRINDTTISQVPYASYAPYWIKNKWNQLIIASDGSGDTNAWLNNNLILNTAIAWTPSRSTNLVIGSVAPATVGSFLGKFAGFKVFKSILSAQEVDDFHNHTTYNYRDRASVILPMRAAQHEATKTLDVSGNGNHAVLGTGASKPTKRSKRGYDFDGGDWMVLGDNLSSCNELSITIPFITSPDSSARYVWTITESDNVTMGVALRVKNTGELQLVHNSGITITSTGLFVSGGLDIVTVTIDSLDKAYITKNQTNRTSEISLNINDRSGEFVISRKSFSLIGSILGFEANCEVLTPLQIVPN